MYGRPHDLMKFGGVTMDELTCSMAGGSGGPATPAAPPPEAESGTSSSDLSRRSAHLGLSLKMWLDSAIRKMVPGSSPTWRKRVMPGGHPYWELKSSVSPTPDPVFGLLPVTTTPTATAILMNEWKPENFTITSKGRLRKTTSKGITGSANWAQEMMARMVLQGNPNLLPTAEACEQFMMIPTGWTKLDAEAPASISKSQRPSGRSSSGKGGIPKFKEGDMGENLCAQDIPRPQAGENLLAVGVGTTPDVEGTKKSKRRNRSRQCRSQSRQKGEMISPLTPSPVTELPPDFDFIASKTDDEKIEYIKSVLARSEDEAIAAIAPALRFCGTAGAVVQAYLPLILEVKKHLCRPGRPKVNPTTGERSKTWAEICEEHLHISIRRMQQVLASLKEPKLSGRASTTSRRPAVDRKDYERAKQVAVPARSLAEAVVKQGMGDRFPDAIEILKLADIPIPDVQPAATVADVNQEPDWKGILTGLAATLEQYGDRLPIPVIKALRSTQELLDGKAKPQAVSRSSTSTERYVVPTPPSSCGVKESAGGTYGSGGEA